MLKQILTLAQFEELWKSGKHTLARWQFGVKIEYIIDQIQIEQSYFPE
ncbi:MAG: hypothetical protein ABSF21_06985 [Dehalococcoidia bacterium]|jgi:hypothetical protein